MYIHGTLLVLVVTSLSKGQSLLYLAYRCAYSWYIIHNCALKGTNKVQVVFRFSLSGLVQKYYSKFFFRNNINFSVVCSTLFDTSSTKI